MKTLLVSVSSLALVAGLSGVAYAADPVAIAAVTPAVAPAPPPPVRTWTGGYVGGHAAFAWGAFSDGASCFDEKDGDFTGFLFIESPGDDFDLGEECLWNDLVGSLAGEIEIGDAPDNYFGWFFDEEDPLGRARGFLAGAQIGFRLQLGDGPNGIVIGAEVATSVSTVSQWHGNWVNGGGDVVFPNVGSPEDAYFAAFVEGTIQMTRLTTATAQLGFAFGQALVYAEGGLAIGSFTYVNNLGFSGATNAMGIVYGGGFEVRVSDRVSVFAEYNRLRFRGISMIGTSTMTWWDQGGDANQVQIEQPTLAVLNLDANVVKVGFNIAIGN